MKKEQSRTEVPPSKVTAFSIVISAMRAMVGVQSNANRERDFQSGRFWHFFIAGGIVTFLFIGSVWLAVKMLMSAV